MKKSDKEIIQIFLDNIGILKNDVVHQKIILVITDFITIQGEDASVVGICDQLDRLSKTAQDAKNEIIKLRQSH